MTKRIVIIVVAIIVAQAAVFAVFSSRQNSRENASVTKKQLLAIIKDDPEFAQAVKDVVVKEEAVSDSAEPPKVDSNDVATTGSTGARGATGQKGDTGASGAAPSSSSVATTYPHLNSVVAPADATTTITSAQVKSGLLVEVAASEGANASRPKVVLPNPVTDSSIRGYTLQLIAQPSVGELDRMGASVGYAADLPGILGDFAALSPSSVDFSGTPLTITYEINGIQKQVTLNQDYSSQLQNIMVDIFAEAIAEGSLELVTNLNPAGNGPNLYYAAVTKSTGDGASISIVDPGPGDPLNLASVSATAGFSAYLGYDGAELGVGELNEANSIGGGFTHSWPDSPGIDQQNLTLVATANGWFSTKTAYRSEFVTYSPTQNWFLTDQKNLLQVLHKFDEEIFNIRARLDVLEP